MGGKRDTAKEIQGLLVYRECFVWKLHHVTPNNNNSSYSREANRCVNFAVNYTDPNCFVNFAENSIDSLLVSSL